MRKPRVIFPYTEAGLGHIVPEKALADAFERLYGDKVEVVRSQFFTESNQPRLKLFEDMLKKQVVDYNKRASLGYFATMNMEFWGIKLSTWATMTFLACGASKYGYRHMRELDADMVVSTHWATNYYAMRIKNRPLTVMYCPDTDVNPLFAYDCDLVMVPTLPGYNKARQRYRARFNDSNILHVPYVIRQAAIDVEGADKRQLRIKNGLDPDKFTVLLAEGGYGLGKMEKICNIILEKDLPVNLVPICGKNRQLYQKFCSVQSRGQTVFHPIGCDLDGIFDFMAASDVFCGKSGSMLAELTFFGVPQIVTKCATLIEKKMAAYYIDYVQSAIKIFDEQAVVDKILQFMSCPDEMQPYIQNAKKQRGNYGAEASAKKIFELLCSKYPHLQQQ